MMTVTTAINALKKSKTNNTNFTVAGEDVDFLLETLTTAKTNKLLVESVLKLLLIEEIDDDKLVDMISEAYEKSGYLSIEKPKKVVKEVEPVVENETTEK